MLEDKAILFPLPPHHFANPKIRTKSSLNSLAVTLCKTNKGEYEKALEFYERYLVIRLKSIGPDHPDVATSYFNIGMICRNQGDFQKAIENFANGFKLKRKEAILSIWPDVMSNLTKWKPLLNKTCIPHKYVNIMLMPGRWPMPPKNQ